MLTQAIDYRDECDALYALLADVDPVRWSQPTQFKRWTLDDVLGHLQLFDYAARLTLEGSNAFPGFWDSVVNSLAAGHSMADYARMSVMGGVMSGSIGVQGHYANGLAALFIACGQDAAWTRNGWHTMTSPA